MKERKKQVHKAPLKQGLFHGSGRGFGFVTPEEGGEDLFIPPRATGGAWDGDKVLYSLSTEPNRSGERRTVARVEEILERGRRTVTGRLVRNRRDSFLVPDDTKLPDCIEIPKNRTGGARGGDKVAVHIDSYGFPKKCGPRASVQAVFGPDGSRDSSVAAILFEQGIREDFSPAALDEARNLPEAPDPADFEGREDLRGKRIFTIDGASAKDLDDAVSLDLLENGQVLLGVHIADVSHHVAQDSPLDRDAFERGTSVYFADRVIPMLPPELSNGLCSLHPGVDRLTLSAFLRLDRQGKLLDSRVCKSVIRSVERMTYADCNRLLEGGDEELEQRYAAILPDLNALADLADTLAKKRRNRGALFLETLESAILCNEEGRPVAILPRPRGRSETLIEECMLCANEAVAALLCEREIPSLFRIHEEPSSEKIEQFRASAAVFGQTLKGENSFSLQAVLDGVRGKPEAPILNSLLLRAMMKAKYSTEDQGHYGLAAEHYCHFTSPIRRYPDLVVHRMLSLFLDGAMTHQQQRRSARFCALAAPQSSQREVAAETAEREIEKLYQAEYMRSRLGQVFPAVVTGVQGFGLFVQVEGAVEGLLPVEELGDDLFHLDEVRMTLRGERTGALYSFGMPLQVRCVAADPATGRIDFALEDSSHDH